MDRTLYCRVYWIGSVMFAAGFRWQIFHIYSLAQGMFDFYDVEPLCNPVQAHDSRLSFLYLFGLEVGCDNY